MEILVGRSNTVTYYGESGWSATATWSKNGEPVGSLPVTTSGDKYSVTLPYLMEEADIDIHWSFTIPSLGTVTKTQKFVSETPLLLKHEVSAILTAGDSMAETPSVAEIDKIERAVRVIIQAHTGQTFGKFTGTKSVPGSGDRALQLPQRLITLDTVNGAVAEPYYSLEADGWVLRHYPWGVPPVKADYYGLHQHVGGVIHNPNSVKMGYFNSSRPYEITGTWGWENVPTPIKEAASLLVNDYACGDSTYRDRYLVSMTAADWRIQFNSGAYAQTGNARADQLLSEYVLKRGWAML